MPPAPDDPAKPGDGGAVQRQRGFFGRRSVLEASGAVKPPEPAKSPAPAPAPPVLPGPRSDTKAGRKAARKAAARAAMAQRGLGVQVRSRRRTSKVALVLLGAAALGVGGVFVAERMMRPACDLQLDPACQQASSSSSSGGGSGGSSSRTSSSSSSSRSSSSSSSSSSSGGSWFSWGGDSSGGSGVAAVPGSSAGDSAVKRGGFGSIGRFFSSGG